MNGREKPGAPDSRGPNSAPQIHACPELTKRVTLLARGPVQMQHLR